MDGFINSKIEKQTIYEIYRACRLCGAGAGYKMPIIQNVVNLDGAEVELKQKIRECVQIEVHQDDKMPPLICELCVDKVNDFYEFLEMCRHTNKRTRLRLGLPPQSLHRGVPDAGDCILGVTEPVFINEDSSDHSSRSRNKSSKSSKNRKVDCKVMMSNNLSRRDVHDRRNETRSLRSKQPSPPRLRGSRRYNDEDEKLSKLQTSKRTSDTLPKSILKDQRDFQSDDNSYLTPRLKRPRDRNVSNKKETQNKKVKIQEKLLPQRATRTSPYVKIKSPPPSHKCNSCKAEFDNYRSLNNHKRSHSYKHADTKQNKNNSKGVKCTDCRKSFPNKMLLNIHRCSKQGGDCSKCNKHFYSHKSLIQHQRSCSQRRKEVYIQPNIRRILKPLQVRVARCDPILRNVSGEHYDVAGVENDFGLDKNCLYPFMSIGGTRIKFEPGYMVDINDDIKKALDADKYVHWDSDDSDSDTDQTDASRKRIDSLVSLSIKTIFSQRFLGKVPKKRRKVKAEKAFDSILNVSDFDTELKRGIDNIIDSLNDDERTDESINKGKADRSGDNDSLFGDDNTTAVTNDDFDSLFDNNKNVSKLDTVKNSDNTCNSDVSENVPKKNDSDGIVLEDEAGGIGRSLEENLINNGIQLTDDLKLNKNEIKMNTELEESSSDMHKDIETEEGNRVDNSKVNQELKSNILLEKEYIETKDLEIEKKSNELIDIENKSEFISRTIDSNIKLVNESSLSITSELDAIENTESSKTNDDSGDINKSNNITNVIENELIEKPSNTEIVEADNVSNRKENSDKVNETRVNGDKVPEEKNTMSDLEDLSDSEMDDNHLMAALDAQIGENEMGDAKCDSKDSDKKPDKIDDMVPSSVRSADLESISDDDFNLNE
ncbi:uncharacterized protein LOC126779901 isoform X2 [Nymphalis io]|uniref:uncharacterized protein LOC126779901 isoform X2 n=1 Tax=Inachis io TaxID=171585 RepID=UPI002168D651|nr:uncharacterized protein LOC126779901 isoform X2 [Nymphalis io]